MSLLWKFLGDIPGDAFEIVYLSGLVKSLEQRKMKTRYSEISTYLRCRQQHQYAYRDQIYPKRADSLPRMDMGTAIHLGFETYFKGTTVGQARLAVEKKAYDVLQQVRGAIAADPMKSPVDDPSKFIAEYEEIVESAPKIFERAALAFPVSEWEPFLVEHTLESEIAPGITLTGTPDLVARNKEGQLFLIDWKTRSAFQDISAERSNMQFAIYQWLLAKAGCNVSGSLTYEIISDVPKQPSVTAKGLVSKSKCRTTLALLDKAIADSDSLPDDYIDLRAYVAQIEWQRSTYHMRREEDCQRIMDTVVIPAAIEMAEKRKPIRCLSRFNCGGCNYAQLCLGELDGDDTAFIRSNSYVNKDGSPITLFEGI